MCIILYVPANKTISKDKLEIAFQQNPDGGGVMWYSGNHCEELHYTKGFMEFDKFYDFWKDLPKDKPRAIHFRIATSGKVSTGCCHPFPIINNLDKMLAKSGDYTDTGLLMHNGIFTEYTPTDGIKSKYSDTMIYTKELVYPLLPVIDNPSVQKLMDGITSRVLMFLPKGKVMMFGYWVKDVKDKEGFYASNTTYKPYVIPTTYTSKDLTYPYNSEPWDEGYSDKDIQKEWWLYLVIYEPTLTDTKKRLRQVYKKLHNYIVRPIEMFKSIEKLGKGQYGVSVCSNTDIYDCIPNDIDVISKDVL